MKKHFLAALLALCLMLTLGPIPARAADTNLSQGPLVISESGDYTVTGGATANTITVKSGATANVTLQNVTITANGAPAIKVENGATLNLTLEGTNSVTGGAGYAGISVAGAWERSEVSDSEGQQEWDVTFNAEASGHLVINGTGSLTAQGGEATSTCGAGAGIGGDGYSSANTKGGNFGVVEIAGGTIVATGGASSNYKSGAGAGIGGGGIYYNVDNGENWTYVGKIKILGGTVTAKGANNTGNFSGSAGIGSGSVGRNNVSNDDRPIDDDTFTVEIAGGTVTATGGMTAAGIGGSANGASGPISISGNAEVSATGGNDMSFGGAGIGGGDNADNAEITIDGSAKVTAFGGGAGAGIGAGGGGSATKITIQGQADVTAYGGYWQYPNQYSGAGIGGGGYHDGYAAGTNCGSILLNSSGTIIAYAGNETQAIGMGRYHETFTQISPNNKVTVGEDTNEVWMFTGGNTGPAFWGQDGDADDFSIDSGKAAIWYTHTGGDPFPAGGTAASSDGADYAWTIDPSALKITSAGEDVASYTGFAIGYTLGNWAYFGTGADTEPIVSKIEVTTHPKLTYTEGETLDLSALQVTVTYDNSSTVILNHDDPGLTFTVGGTRIQHGDQLTVADHHGQVITVTHQGLTAQTNALAVTAKQPEPTPTPGGDTTGGEEIRRDPYLRFDSNGGTKFDSIDGHGEEFSINVYDDHKYGAHIPARPGYRFTGWYRDRNLTRRVDEEELLRVRDVTTLFAGWAETSVPSMLNGDDHYAYIQGYSDGSVRPNQSMTRAEAAQMFYTLLRDKDVPATVTFSDVAADAWYAAAVNTLATLDVVGGVGDNLYEPERAITRAEFTAIVMGFADLGTGRESIFSDVHEQDWFHDVVLGAAQYGWIEGYPDGTFRPYANITRAEVAAVVNRMLGRSADAGYIERHTASLRQFSDLARSHWAYYDIAEAANGHSYRMNGGTEEWTGLD